MNSSGNASVELTKLFVEYIINGNMILL